MLKSQNPLSTLFATNNCNHLPEQILRNLLECVVCQVSIIRDIGKLQTFTSSLLLQSGHKKPRYFKRVTTKRPFPFNYSFYKKGLKLQHFSIRQNYSCILMMNVQKKTLRVTCDRHDKTKFSSYFQSRHINSQLSGLHFLQRFLFVTPQKLVQELRCYEQDTQILIHKDFKL